LDLRADPQGGYLKQQCIARDNWTSKTGGLDPAEKGNLFITVLEFTKGEYRSDLCEGLYLQNSGHHRCLRKVAGEKVLVDRHLLYAEDPCSWFELYDLVDKKKRIAMREDLLYRH
jgi:hypothetical protein